MAMAMVAIPDFTSILMMVCWSENDVLFKYIRVNLESKVQNKKNEIEFHTHCI